VVVADAASVAQEIMEYLLLQLRDASAAPNAAPPEMHIANGALFGFTRAGLIDDASAADWREQIDEELRRFLAARKEESAHRAPAFTPEPPQIERATIQEVLNDQLAQIEIEIAGAAYQGRVLYPWNSRALSVAYAVVRALAELGVLSELEEREWNEKLKRAGDPESEAIRTAHSLARSAVHVEARPAPPVPDAPFPLVHPRPECSRTELVEVLLVRAGPEDGLRVEFIELYRDGFVVDWSGPPIAHHPRGSSYPPRMTPRARATDDLGTYYFALGGGGGGSSGERSRGQQIFAPAIPPQATELHVTLDYDYGFLISLPSQTAA
jgi:hypothetical protein